MNPFSQLLGLSVVALVLGLFIFPLLLLSLAIPYAVLRLRDSRALEHDNQIGLKCVLHFIYSLSILLILGGVTLIVVDFLLEPDTSTSSPSPVQPGFGNANVPPSRTKDVFRDQQRVGAGLIVSGVLVGGLHLMLIVAVTNQRKWPEARRVFVGWRLAVHGLVILTAFTALVVLLFQESFDVEATKALGGILLVWIPSWVVHLVLLYLYRGTGSRPNPAARIPEAIVVD